MNILGAGLAGLLAAHYFRDQSPVIYEKQSKLPENHMALFRLRSDAIGRITGVPLRKVQVQKAVMDEEGDLRTTTSLRDANSYSYKVLGKFMPRSVLNLDTVERWVPDCPQTFVADLANGVQVNLDTEIDIRNQSFDEITISTLPLPIWWGRLAFPHIEFVARPITVVTAKLPPHLFDLYQTVYVPYGDDHFWSVYRISITGSTLIIEMTDEPHDAHLMDIVYRSAEAMFGCIDYDMLDVAHVTIATQARGKIAPIDTTLRKRAIIKLTDDHNIISFGRFATWRPLVMDDLVNDLEVIRKLQNNPYARRLHYAAGE